jgi:hypothetical protein
MKSAELIDRLRREGGFRWLPLLGNTGQVTGVHLTRFLPGGYLDVVQAWDERWAAWTRLHDEPNADAPFVGPAPTSVLSGPFARVTASLLPLRPADIDR